MSIKSIFKVARMFELKLYKYASYPSPETVQPTVERVVNSLKGSSNDLKSVKGISTVDVQNSIENICYVYFQLIVESNNYTDMNSEPRKTEISNLLVSPIEQELKNKFPSFEFKVKIGIFPD